MPVQHRHRSLPERFFGSRPRHYACVAVGALVLGACSADHSTGLPPSDVGTPRLSASPPGSIGTLDDSLAALSDANPGFGGMFIDTDGALTVYFTDTTQRKHALPLVSAFVARGRATDPTILRAVSTTRVRQGKYTFRQLYDWRHALNVSGQLTGITRVDIDDRENHIAIGVLDQTALVSVRGRLRHLRVPDSAAVVEIRAPNFTHTTLQDFVRPVLGGMQISSAAGICTLGFHVRLGNASLHFVDSATTYFVTNSHCSLGFGFTDGVTFGQPTAADIIGSEIYDRPMFTSSTNSACPAGRNCRYADVTLARYNTGVQANFPRVAHPWLGSLTLVPTPLTVAGYDVTIIPGDPLFKIGRTSGYSGANVSAVCVNEPQYEIVNGNVHDTGRTMLCQAEVQNMWSYPGDSGGPVMYNGTGTPMVGLAWGGNQNITIYSPILYVLNDIDSWPGRPADRLFTPYNW